MSNGLQFRDGPPHYINSPNTAAAALSAPVPTSSASSAPSGYISFQLDAWGSNPNPPTVSVLCGDNAPTITDGYGIWQTIARPLLRGVPVFQGYNPTQMSIDLRFGNWAYGQGWDMSGSNGQPGGTIEGDISIMGQMAGEGAPGIPPIVHVNAFGYPSGPSNLIPKQWQGPKVAWVISALAWGLSYRNSNGDRIWQEATVTLTQFLSVFQNAPKQTTSQQGGFFTTTPSIDTAFKIASAKTSHAPTSFIETLARRIVSASQNAHYYPRSTNASIHQKLKVGVKIWVPSHTYA